MMNRILKNILPLALILISLVLTASEPDAPFKQPVSVKYRLNENIKGAKFEKVLVDYDDNVFVLSNKGVCRVFDDVLAHDKLYSSLADKKAVDICLQEGTGYVYYLYNNGWLTNAYAGIPYGNIKENRFAKIAVAQNGDVFLAGEKYAAVVSKGKTKEGKMPSGILKAVYVHKSKFYVLSENTLYLLSDNMKFELLHSGDNIQAVTFRENEVVIGTTKGYYGVSLENGKESFALQTKVPVPNIQSLTVNNKGLWAGTQLGAYYREPSGKFRYFVSKRWLGNDNVVDMASDSKGNMYLISKDSLSKIDFVDMTLANKADFLQNKIRQRHMRYGFTTGLLLEKPCDVTSGIAVDSDNDGSWTAFWLGSQALRYDITGEEVARRYVWESFEAYERLHTINQLDGFPSRTFERKGYKFSDVKRWADSPDPAWEWKGHTSADEFVSYLFVSLMMDKFVAQTESEKARVAKFLDEVLMHLINNDYYFVDIDGKPTKWGRWNPDYVNWYPKTIIDRRTRSVELIAGLQMAYRLTGKEIYKTEAYRLINEHGYLDNILIDVNGIKETPGYIHLGADMGSGGWNHVDDHLAFMTYWVLTNYAFPEYKDDYKKAILNHWGLEKAERNSLWNMIVYATTGENDEESVFWHLRDFPLDLIRYSIKNSHRKDLNFREENFRKDLLDTPLSPLERPIHRHNTTHFQVDANSFFDRNLRELCGDEYLLPYWMARYFGVIEE